MGADRNVAPVIIKRKKVIAGGGHHGGAWKVAYADFVTAMMAFFMLMWLLNATTEKQRKGIADYFSPTIPINRISGGGDGAFGGDSIFSENVLPQMGTGAMNLTAADAHQSRGIAGLDDSGRDLRDDAEIFGRIEQALLGFGGESMAMHNALKHVVTRVTDEGLVIDIFDLPGRPLFVDGTSETRVLQEIVGLLSSVMGLVTNDIAVEGHVPADAVVRAEKTAWSLSAARANRMRTLLEISGVEAGRMQRVTGHSDREPVDAANPMSPRNSRLEVILLRAAPMQ